MFKEFCAFDLALALYHWLQHNWNGMDDLYMDHCRLTRLYRPSRSDEYFDNMAGEACHVYAMLERDNYQQALEIVLNYKNEE